MKTGYGCPYLAIPILNRQRQEDVEFKARMGYISSPCLQKPFNNHPPNQTFNQPNNVKLVGERKESVYLLTF